MTRPPTPNQPDSGSAGAEDERTDTSADALEAHLNLSLNEVLDLLGREVERLKVELEYHRLSDAQDSELHVRRCVDQIDARQDRMEEVKAMILARGDLLH